MNSIISPSTDNRPAPSPAFHRAGGRAHAKLMKAGAVQRRVEDLAVWLARQGRDPHPGRRQAKVDAIARRVRDLATY